MDTNELPDNANDFAELFESVEDTTTEDTLVTTEVIDENNEPNPDQIVDLTGDIIEAPTDTIPENTDDSLSVMFNYLKEKQALMLPDDFQFNGSEEEFEKALEYSKQIKEQTTFNELLDALPEDYKNTILFGLQSGKPLKEFFEYTNALSLDNVDLANKADQISLLQRYYTQVANFPQERADKLIQSLDRSGELAEAAVEYYEELKQYESARAEELIVQEQERREAEARRAYQIRTTIANAIDTTPVIPDTRKAAVKSFLFNEVAKGKEVTTNYNRVLASIQNNPEHMAQLADILMDYDSNRGIVLDRFNNQVKSNAVKSIKQQLLDAKSNIKPTVSGTPGAPPSQNFDWDAYMAKIG